MILLSERVKSWSHSLLVWGGLALVGCGGATLEEFPTSSTEAQPSTHRAAEHSEGDCDGPNDCVVPCDCSGPRGCPTSCAYVDCGPGRPQAYAWRTNDGGFCISRDACGRDVYLCPYFQPASQPGTSSSR